MKENKYGCRKSGDVCLIHSSPLLGFDFCEDSETIKDFKNELMRKIEKAIDKMKKTQDEVDDNDEGERYYNKAIDDLKPIISNLLK